MSSVSLSPKIHQNSTGSPTKRKRLETGIRKPSYPDEKLRLVTEKLIEELERVQKKGKNVPSVVDAPSKTLTTSKQFDSVANQCNYLRKPKIECPLKSHHIISEYQSLHEQPNLVDTKTSDVRGGERYNDSTELDWLEMIRRVTHDKTLTPQQRDEELDQIAKALIGGRNGLLDGI
ncbi:hypothetical protein Aperf_G00000101510 [Anoplocephala perfoliata]